MKKNKLKNDYNDVIGKSVNLEQNYMTKIKESEDRISKLSKKKTELDKEENKILINVDESHTENIVLDVSPHKPLLPLKNQIWNYITGKKEGDDVQGYIFYLDKNYNLALYDIKKGFDNIFKVVRDKYGEAYNLHKYMGIWNNKRFFMVKFTHAISLELYQEKYATDGTESTGEQTEVALAYDSVAYYNLLEHQIKRNITMGEQPKANDIITLISQYWYYVVVIIIFGYLFLTPQGKEILTGIVGSFKS